MGKCACMFYLYRPIEYIITQEMTLNISLLFCATNDGKSLKKMTKLTKNFQIHFTWFLNMYINVCV